MKARLTFLYMCMMIASVFIQPVVFAQKEASPENIMATYIYNFTNYIEWPKTSNDNEFSIVILGGSKLEKPLRYIASVKNINDIPISIISVDNPEKLVACEILIVTDEFADKISALKSSDKLLNTVIISNLIDGLEKGASINFITTGGRIRFEIDHSSIKNQGLKVSSRLLKIAEKVI